MKYLIEVQLDNVSKSKVNLWDVLERSTKVVAIVAIHIVLHFASIDIQKKELEKEYVKEESIINALAIKDIHNNRLKFNGVGVYN